MFESLHPNLLALFAAILLAVANILYRDSLRELSPAVASLVTHLVMGSIACGVYAASSGVEKWPLAGIFWFVLAGFVGNFLGRYLLFVSIHFIGVARTTVLSQTQPIWSSILALIFLGESIGLGAGAGTLGIVIGASIIVLGRKEKEEEGILNTTLTLYFLPFLVALVHAIAPIFRKFGFALIPSAPFAIGVATLFSAALQLAVLSFTERGGGHRWDRGALRSIMIGASINTLAALCFWTAIKDGVVVEVVPIRRLSVLFVLLFSWLFLRKLENLNWRVVTGAVLSVIGGMAIILNQ
jgi:uncharacterized membrane protein